MAAGGLEASKDIVDVLVCSDVLAFEKTQACHFIYMYNGQGQIYSSEYKSFQWGILVNNSQFGLVHHFGLWRDRPEEVDDKVDGEEMVTGLGTADGMGM